MNNAVRGGKRSSLVFCSYLMCDVSLYIMLSHYLNGVMLLLLLLTHCAYRFTLNEVCHQWQSLIRKGWKKHVILFAVIDAAARKLPSPIKSSFVLFFLYCRKYNYHKFPWNISILYFLKVLYITHPYVTLYNAVKTLLLWYHTLWFLDSAFWMPCGVEC